MRQRTRHRIQPRKQQLPDEKPHDDRPGPGAGSVWASMAPTTSIESNKTMKITRDARSPAVGSIRLHAFGLGPRANQLEVDGLTPVCRGLDPHRDIGALGQRSCPRCPASLLTGGVQIGCAGGHLDGSSPAAENSGAQSGDDAAPAGFSTSGGTAMSCVRRPSGLSLTSVIPDTSNGGSSVHTNPNDGCIRGERGGTSRERAGAAAIPKHKRPGLEVVPARLGFVVFRDIA